MRAVTSFFGQALAVALAGFVMADDDIVLPPVTIEPSLPERMLVFIPGGKVPTENYRGTAAAIQRSTTQVRLWVVIPAVFNRLCIISCSSTSLCATLHGSVEGALSKAVDAGWKRTQDSETTWLAGHSLGGVCANTLFQAYSSNGPPYAGLIVMGSYVDESGNYDAVHYPKPVLTLNVELDGLTRPGKTAVWWRQHESLSQDKGEEFAVSQKPVIVLPQLNHSDFCPGFDVSGDLMAEVDQVSATKIIGEVVASFMHMQTEGVAQTSKDEAQRLIKAKVSWTRSLLSPYLKAQDWERTASDVSISTEGSSPFCAHAQHIVAGLSPPDDARLHVGDGFHGSSSNLEHCHPNYTQVEGGALNVLSCSHTDYYPDVLNTGTITAASEIACKMLSSDRVTQQLNTKASNPNVDCSAGNKYAVELAEGLAFSSTLDRYKRGGRGWCFEADAPTVGNIGPVWVFKDALTLEERPTCMAVTSPALKTAVDGMVYPGNHYCKFLSPARVLDWMMTDSLKSMTRVEQDSALQTLVV